MSNELTIKQENALSTEVLDTAWDTELVEAKDIRIPRILLMQAMSDLVGERKAVAGDMVNSITAEKVGDEKSPLKVVPIHTFKTWAVHEKVNGKFEYKRTEEYTPANANRPREEVINGVDTQNVETINLLCIRADQLDQPDALPVLIAFRMTSYACGKDILTLKVNCTRINKPLPFYTITLNSHYTSNDKGNFFLWKYSGATPTQDFAKHAPVLKGWFDTFKAGQTRVDEEVAEASHSEATHVPSQTAGDKF